MKKIVAFVFLIIAIGVAYFVIRSDSSESTEQDAISNILKRQSSCWNNGNIDCFMVGYWKSDSLKFVSSQGVTYGYENVMENYKVRYPSRREMGELSFEIIDFDQLSDDVALVIGKFKLERLMGDADGYFSLVLRKVDGDWVIVADHTSVSDN